MSMPIEYEVPEPWNDRGWRVKIQDKERVEPPHVTVLFKRWKWRFGLREKDFLDKEPSPGDVPGDLVRFLEDNVGAFCSDWGEMYPDNPVDSQDA
jgi:hypothetical protein